jgi:hypothetical protein
MHALKRYSTDYCGIALLVFALSASLSLNVYLGWRVRGLAPRGTTASGIQAGSRLPESLPVLTVDGRHVSLDFNDSRTTVLYILSPSCGWCRKNEANIKTVSAAAASRFRFVGLSLVSTNLKEYVAEGHAPFPVFALQSPEQAAKLGFGSTPTTLIVGPGNRVEKVWLGAYMRGNEKPIEQFFGVRLPGLVEVKASAN